jgi:ribose transport system ATP-binding protein
VSLLSLRGVRRAFGATVALDGVTLDLDAGEVLAVIGENGAGKSTLLNIVAGAMRPDAGEVSTGGARVAYIHQELSLFPHLSVAENICMGTEPGHFGFIDREAMNLKARGLLDEFGRPGIGVHDIVGGLPPASRQVVEICRALAMEARIILMDEPTSSLERADVERLFTVIRRLCARGIGIVYVSHFLEEVREIASRAVVLRDGRSVWSGPLSGTSDRELIGHMVGRQVETRLRTDEAGAPGEIVLTAAGFANASFTLRRGEVLGIAGLVGSGRTELLRALYGLDRVPTSGISLRGEDLPARELSPGRSIERGVGYVSEDRSIEGLFPQLSVRENLTMTRLDGADVSPLIARLRIKVGDVEDSIQSLSGGNQQKVLIARLLHQRAEILLLDEPARGIDVGAKAEIYGLIRDLAGEGRAIILVSSYLPELFEVCDRLAVMTRGRLSEARPLASWTPESVLEAAVGGGPLAA